MTDENKDIFYKHAISVMPKEACAVLVIRKGREQLFICENKSTICDQFTLCPNDYARAADAGEIVAIVHSHVFQPPAPSEADKVSCEATKLEWFICSVPNGHWHSFKPSGFKAPLVGRTWSHGVLDCYSLVRDYYREILKIELMDFDREFEWYFRGHNLYCEENLSKAGFRQVDISDLKPNDGLIMQVRAPVPNHAGVYLGDDQFLHQLSGRLSSRDVYAGYYRKHTIKVVRYCA